MIRLSILLVLTCIMSSSKGTECQCEKALESETTHWGWKQLILRHEAVTKRIEGKVLDSLSKPMSGVLVEVFNDPDVLFMQPTPSVEERRRKQQRVAACKVGHDGRFCFAGLRAGRYELRCSKAAYDAPQMIVVVDPKRPERQITVTLPVSQ